MKIFGLAVLVYFIKIIHFSFACNGYGATLVNIENGNDHQAITLESTLQVEFNSECQLTLDGCICIKPETQPLRSIKLSYTAKKNGKLSVLNVKYADLCKVLRNSDYPYQCPVEETGRICDDNRNPIDLSMYRELLPSLEGRIIVDAEVITNDEDKSCFELTIDIFKN